jgi:hypothetical protein
MPPTEPVSLRDLINSTSRLADATLAQTHAINKLALAQERLIPAFEQIRRDLYDIKTGKDNDDARIDLALGEINTKLALLLDMKLDVKSLTREVTGAHLLAPHEKPPTVVAVINAFEGLRTVTKLLILALIIILGAAGWLKHLIE